MQLIVLGMHRSGTSVVTRMLNLMGAYFGPEGISMGLHEDNMKGFWERKDIYQINEKILHSASASWYRISDFNLENISQESSEALAQKLQSLLLEIDAHRPWVIKDPRLCVTFPFWYPFLEIPICIHIYRNPIQVAKSLHQRNGFPLVFGVALWETYNLRALEASRELPRVLVSYSDLIDKPVDTVKHIYEQLMGFGLNGLRLPIEKEISEFVSNVLFRQRDSIELHSEFLNEKQLALWQALESGEAIKENFSLEGSLAGHEILAFFDEVESQNKKNEQQYKSQVREHNNIIQDYKNIIQDYKTKYSSSMSEIGKLREKLDTRVADSSLLKTKIEKQNLESLELRKSIKLLQKESASQHSKLVSQSSILDKLNKEIRQKSQWLDQFSTAIDALYHSWRWKIGDKSMRAIELGLFRKKTSLAIDHLLKIASLHQSTKKKVNRQLTDKHNSDNTVRDVDNKQQQKASTSPSTDATTNYVEEEKGTHIGRLSSILKLNSSCLDNYLDNKEIDHKPKVSIIILNRNGEDILKEFFESFISENKYSNFEIIFVDHNSDDGSIELVEKWLTLLPIKLIQCNDNYTYSFSNNRAAEISSGEFLLFLNNDIFFQQDVITSMVSLLAAHRDIGAIGLKQFQSLSPIGSVSEYHHIGIRFHWDDGYSFFRPYNLALAEQDLLLASVPSEFPAVTASILLCRKDDFLVAGGFSENYIYGYEDVDFCLKLRARLNKKIVSLNNHFAVHRDSYTRSKVPSLEVRNQRLNNIQHFRQRFGYVLRRELSDKLLFDDGSWTGRRFSVAFAVTESGDGAVAGDYFTALELCTSLTRKFNWSVQFLSRGAAWYDLKDFDLLIVMLDSYDLSKISSQKPNLIKVAWLRNWLPRWLTRPSLRAYDLVLCSSLRSIEFLKENKIRAELFRIATNHRRFQPLPKDIEDTFDYVFTGNYWNTPRDIETMLRPDQLPYRGAVYGSGWEKNDCFKSIHQGFIPYNQLPKVYNQAKIVIDDTVSEVTKPWGMVNSRVYDALASGTLVISDNKLGVTELFGDLLPTYSSKSELESHLQRYLGDDTLRKELAGKLQNIILTEHTYDTRAEQLFTLLHDFVANKYRIAIKAPVPNMAEAKHWGDYYFALGLQKALKMRGHSVRVDLLPDWDSEFAKWDDMVIVIRGLSEYKPKQDQINIIWNISHPEKIPLDEFAKYDHIFVASKNYASYLDSVLDAPVSCLLQCTDPDVFRPLDDSQYETDILFVGNSRKQRRKIVDDAISSGFPVSVYGSLWDGIISDKYVQGVHIPNDELYKYYSNAKILLNDHWPFMAKHGFLSNRLFDGAAAGALIVSDEAQGIRDIFGDSIITYQSADELKKLFKKYLSDELARREKREQLRELVLRAHTFEHRADEISRKLDELHRQRMQGPNDAALQAGGGFLPSLHLRA